jgi:hypothetical protein
MEMGRPRVLRETPARLRGVGIRCWRGNLLDRASTFRSLTLPTAEIAGQVRAEGFPREAAEGGRPPRRRHRRESLTEHPARGRQQTRDRRPPQGFFGVLYSTSFWSESQIV